MAGHSKWANIRRRESVQALRRDRRLARAEPEGSETVRYEGYGPGGVAVIVEALTDNRNRTASEVRAAFAKSGGARQIGRCACIGPLERRARDVDGVADLRRAQLTGFHG